MELLEGEVETILLIMKLRSTYGMKVLHSRVDVVVNIGLIHIMYSQSLLKCIR